MPIQEQFVTSVVLDTVGQTENLKGIVTVDPTQSVSCGVVSSDRLLHIQAGDVKVSITVSDLEEILKRTGDRPSQSFFYDPGTIRRDCDLPEFLRGPGYTPLRRDVLHYDSSGVELRRSPNLTED